MKTYTLDEKQNILIRYKNGESVANISESAHIPRTTIYSWLKAEKESEADIDFTLHNFHLLQNKVKRLESIIEVLQQVDCTAKSSTKQKLYALEELYGKYPVHVLCDALQVPRGTFYNHIKRNKKDNTWYERRKSVLCKEIQKIFNETHQLFGAKKILALLQEQGFKTSEKTVRSLMQEMGLKSVRTYAKKNYDKEQKPYKNYLNQQFTVKKPNEVWVSDITYFNFHKDTFYICVILDLYARRIVAYHISKRQTTNLVTKTFKLAYESRKPDCSLIFHTDRGSQYRSYAFQALLKSLGIQHSFSRAHVPYDNSVMESFFSNFKKEELWLGRYTSENNFKKGVENYMNFYNTKRPHMKNQNQTPCKKEDEYWQKHKA